jgi:hypothetical protein
VCCGTSCWTIWGGGHRCVVRRQYTACCSTSSWTIWGGGHRCVEGCQYPVCGSTSSWTTLGWCLLLHGLCSDGLSSRWGSHACITVPFVRVSSSTHLRLRLATLQRVARPLVQRLQRLQLLAHPGTVTLDPLLLLVQARVLRLRPLQPPHPPVSQPSSSLSLSLSLSLSAGGEAAHAPPPPAAPPRGCAPAAPARAGSPPPRGSRRPPPPASDTLPPPPPPAAAAAPRRLAPLKPPRRAARPPAITQPRGDRRSQHLGQERLSAQRLKVGAWHPPSPPGAASAPRSQPPQPPHAPRPRAAPGENQWSRVSHPILSVISALALVKSHSIALKPTTIPWSLKSQTLRVYRRSRWLQRGVTTVDN